MGERKKIAIVSYYLSCLAGGPRLIYSLARELEQQGHEVTIYAPDYDKDIFGHLSQGLTIRDVRLGRPLEWSGAEGGILSRVLYKIREERMHARLGKKMAKAIDTDIDMINCHDVAYPVFAYYRKRNKNAYAVWTMNEPPYMYLPKKSRLYDLLSRLYNWTKDLRVRNIYRAIDVVVVLNNKYTGWLAARGLTHRVIRPAAEYDYFYAAVRERRKSDTSAKLLSIGAPTPYRRYEDTIRAAGLLRRDGYDARVTIIGKNIWREDKYCDWLASVAKEEGMERYTTFHFDGVSEDELREAYQACDVFMLPLHVPPPRDGYGWQLTPFEAMAAGKPVVVSRKVDIVEVLEDGKTGLFANPTEPEDFAKKVRGLLEDPDAYNRIARDGQAFIRDNLSWRHYAEEMLQLIRA